MPPLRRLSLGPEGVPNLDLSGGAEGGCFNRHALTVIPVQHDPRLTLPGSFARLRRGRVGSSRRSAPRRQRPLVRIANDVTTAFSGMSNIPSIEIGAEGARASNVRVTVQRHARLARQADAHGVRHLFRVLLRRFSRRVLRLLRSLSSSSFCAGFAACASVQTTPIASTVAKPMRATTEPQYRRYGLPITGGNSVARFGALRTLSRQMIAAALAKREVGNWASERGIAAVRENYCRVHGRRTEARRVRLATLAGL